MDGKKVYQIEINGIKDSISAVDALNKALNDLEQRIKSLEKSSVSVSASGGKGNSAALSEEAAVQKEINKLKKEGATLDAKIIAAQDEVYKKVDATKQLYKETVADQKTLAAQERLTADAYSNTMQGMKSQLADLKAVINTTDLADTDKIKQMTQQANELTTKLKQMEEAYGQFGRNVGNYQDAANGFKGLAIQVGDVTQKFDNAKQALKELKKERDTLATKKELGIISEEEAKRLQDLIPTVAQLQSAIQDAGKPMDALMDTMQSFVAITQVSKGLGAFFGFDNAEIDKTIKNLVALQNAMQGLQTIQKQIQTREGIGAWIAPFTVQIDKATAKLLTFNTALLGTGKAAKVAGVAIKGFSKALKVALSAGVLIVVDLLVDGLMNLIDSLKKVDEAAERDKEVQKDLAEAYGQAQGKLIQYKTKVDSFNGSKKEEKKLVEELNKEFGDTLGTYKSLAEWQDVLKQKGEAYIQTLINQAKAQAALNEVTAAYMNLESVKQKAANGDYSHWYQSRQQDAEAAARAIEEANQRIAKAEENLANTIKANDEYAKEHGVGNYAPQITKNGQKTKKAVDDVQKTLNELEMRLMKEGLNKKLKQLDEEERQTINKLQENGRKSAEAIQKIQRAYAALRAKEIQEYLKTLEENIKQSSKNIESIQFDINTKEIDNKIDALDNKIELWKDHLEMSDVSFQPLTSNSDLKQIGRENVNQLKDSFDMRYQITERYYSKVIDEEIAFMQDEKALNEERIKEREKKDRKAEQDRYTIQMSGLTQQRKDAESVMKNIVERYGEITEEGAIVIKNANKETIESYKKAQADVQEIDAQIETAKKQHKTILTQITTDANNAIKKNEIDTAKDISATQEKYFNLQIVHYRDLISKINSELDKSPIYNKNTGIVDKEATRKQYLDIINAAEEAFRKIEKDKKDLDDKLDEGLITEEACTTTKKNLDEIKAAIEGGYREVLEKNVNLTSDYLKSLEMYIQAAFQMVSTVMNGVFDAINNGFDEEQDALDREYEQMQDALDKRRDAIKDYSNEINSIEDELATARGSRRQHLIDQLNAEMELQRESMKEKQRLDKEEQKNKEQMQKKQDALDKKRRKAQWYQDLAQAVVNGAMAVTYAAMNTWPLPAIPMMQLAAATSAVQLAVIAANHPFEKGGQLDGGVAVGARHRDGGIPVLGGRASIEGGEFITNRQTTAKNVDLLDYINSKHRKLNIDDFIDFYSSGKAKKNFMSSNPKTKFADGGTIPMLNNDYNFDDRLLSAFEDYSNRPVYVSVVDINRRQTAVKNVEVLAGLGE